MLAILAIAAWLLFGALAITGSAGYRRAPEEHDEAKELRYVVPEGQDPAAILAALTHHGYRARLSDAERLRVVCVTCPHGKDLDRDDVRAVIAGVGTTLEDTVPFPHDVHFLDEPVR